MYVPKLVSFTVTDKTLNIYDHRDSDDIYLRPLPGYTDST